jgi:hypothetical protein
MLVAAVPVLPAGDICIGFKFISETAELVLVLAVADAVAVAEGYA